MLSLKRIFTLQYIIMLLAIIVIYATNISHAKLSSIDNTPVEIVDIKKNINLAKDYSLSVSIYKKYRILNERGREQFNIYNITYNENNEKVVLKKAQIITNGKVYDVNQENIEDKQISSGNNGFDSYRNIKIAFPQVAINSQIIVEYILYKKNAEIEGIFENKITLGDIFNTRNYELVINSPVDLFVERNDPDNKLLVEKLKTGDSYKIKVKLLSPIFYSVINEPDGILNPKKITWMVITNNKSWLEGGKKAFEEFDYLKEKKQLAPMFQDIIDKAKKYKNSIDQINFVTTSLIKKMNYMGDWRTIKGRFAPQELEVIQKSLSGDCKDFSYLTAMILNKLGYGASVSLVNRGYNYVDDKRLPYISMFNHAIVKVVDKHNNIYWIDPTNRTSMADGIYDDIANRRALILSENPTIETIPNIEYNHNQIISKNEFFVNNSDVFKQKTEIQFLGESALYLTGAENYISKSEIERAVLSLYNPQIEKDKIIQIDIPDLKSIEVKDLVCNYTVLNDKVKLQSNLGSIFDANISFLTIYNLANLSGEEVADFNLGIPSIVSKETILHGVIIDKLDNLNVEIKNDYFSLTRHVKYKDSKLVIADKLTIYKNIIPNEFLKSKEMQDTIKKLSLALKSGYIVYRVK